MNKQHTNLRYTRDPKIYHDQCAETHVKVDVTERNISISISTERPANTPTTTRKETKLRRRKKRKAARKSGLSKRFKQLIKDVWSWCHQNRKLLFVILCVMVRNWNPEIKKVILDEQVLQVIQLILNFY